MILYWCVDHAIGLIVAFAVAVIAFLVFVGVMMSREASTCAQRGGQMVASGPPIYVRAGNVLIPVESKHCVVNP